MLERKSNIHSEMVSALGVKNLYIILIIQLSGQCLNWDDDSGLGKGSRRETEYRAISKVLTEFLSLTFICPIIQASHNFPWPCHLPHVFSWVIPFIRTTLPSSLLNLNHMCHLPFCVLATSMILYAFILAFVIYVYSLAFLFLGSNMVPHLHTSYQ